MVEKIYNLVEILDRDVVKNGDGVTPFQFKLSYSDGKAVDLKDKRVYVSFASTTTYLFKKKAEVDSKGTISITLNDADPIIEGNTEIEISVESSNGKSQKFPSQDGEHGAFVYISKSIESLDSRVISTYTLKQFSDKIDILMGDLDKKYDDHLDNLKKDVGDYIDNSVEDKVDEIKAVAKESMDASIKASKDSTAASLSAKNSVNATATKATTDINKVSTDATKNITDTSNAAVATVNAKGDAALKAFSENGQVPKITADTGAPRYDLSSTKDLFSEISTWGNGFFTFYLSAGATNNPTGTKSWLRGRVSTYGKNSDVLSYDKDGTMYIVVCANGIWGSWDKTAMSSKTQNSKITNDDGSSITVSGYDLLNVEDVKNYDGYVTNPENSPSSGGSGYFKRKYREGYIEITFAPHSTKDVYRNAYNFSTKLWVGWEKFAYDSDIATTQKRKITSDNGAPLYDLNSSKDLFAEILTWGNGLFTFYLSPSATNNPTGTASWLRGTATTYGKNSNVLAYDKVGAMYTAVCANGVWGIWGKQQMYKTTADDGSSLTLSNYDLLNTADISNFDGYATNSLNAPSGMSASGFVKRKYRAGYIEVTFAPHSQKDVYRNSYNDASKTWVGWEKAANQSDLTHLIGSNTGWLPLPLLNGVTASTPCFYRFYSTNGIYYLSFKGVLNTLSTRDVIVAKLPAEVTTKIDRPLTWVGNTSVSANAARFNRWVVEADGTIKFAISNFGSAGESGAWNPLDVTLTL